MINKLIPMTDFVLQEKGNFPTSVGQFADHVCDYASFLKQPLKLEMFVPCINGVPVNEPPQYIGALELSIGKDYDDALAYKEAEEKIFFEGFKMCDRTGGGCVTNDDEHVLLSISLGRSIEILTSRHLTLTQSAINLIYPIK